MHSTAQHSTAQHSTAQHNLSKLFKHGGGFILFTALTLAGCGGGDGGNGGNGSGGGGFNLTGAVTTPLGNPGVSGSADGTGSAASFNFPLGITSDKTNLYVADTNNHTIRQIVIASGVVSTLAGTAGAALLTDGTGSAARFKNPRGITTDGTNLICGRL